MKFFLALFGLLNSVIVFSQSVSDINFSYWYNLSGEVNVQFYSVRQRDSVRVIYSVRANNPSITNYRIQWEKRDSYNQRQGAIIIPDDTLNMKDGRAGGSFNFPLPEKPWLLVAKVTNPETKKAWIYFRQIEKHHPVNGFLAHNGQIQAQAFVSAAGTYSVFGSGSGKNIHFSYYKDNFPTPSPPFADRELKLDPFLFPDSTFTVTPGDKIGPFPKEGLYLGQEDTLSAEGFSFLVKNDPYPRYNTLGDLKGPLLFVTTPDENNKVGAAGEDKGKFDRVILDITGDKDRAKNFMRSYFKRIEYANYAFTSFKEGWKTDRGMIIIVFGAPDEVSVNGAQEIWSYRNPRQDFFFNKSGSVYGPDYYVLVRDRKYAENWYMTIDLWRKSRF